jgi:hypothetical protein
MEGRPPARGYAVWLAILLGLFCLRVLGQVLVALFGVEWLPAMDEWQSGLLPYPVLLTAQALIIGLLGKVCLDFGRGLGFFVEPSPKLARFALPFGQIYFASMVVRYALRMTLHPEARWLGGTIPIFFHWVLASYVMTFGHFHRAQLEAPRANDRR